MDELEVILNYSKKAVEIATRLGEKKKTEPSLLRSQFEVDYDRIIFSRPFRNLQDKTQVFPLPDQDFGTV